MSTESENDFDLDKLFLPAWAQEPSSAKYSKYEGGEDRPDRRQDGGGRRPQRRDRPPDRPRDGGNRPPGVQGRGRSDGPRPGGPRRDRPAGDRSGPRHFDRPQRPAPEPLPDIGLELVPDAKGVESLARQIKMSGRAYPLFDIAQLILQKPERHNAVFSTKKNAEGKPIQQLFLCVLDDTLWLSEEEAVGHVLKKHFATFYQIEKTAAEPPKGKYTFVAQCGISGVILGPPNHHDYQNQLRKLHNDRFSRMPFETYKNRVKIVRDEEVVKKWIDEQSWKTEFVVLNQPDPLRLENREAVDKHFRETHKDTIIKPVDTHTLNGAAARALRSPELTRAFRVAWEDQKRFPLQIATVLSQQFAGHGLQFFKVNKTITHVSVARPHFLDLEATPVSDGIKRIVTFINENPKSSRRKLIETLAPSPAPEPVIVAPENPTPAPAAQAPTAEQTAVIADLHWLIHQGHVIEFANGTLETAKKPLPKPPRPEPKARPQEKPAADSPAAAESQPAPAEGNSPAAEVTTEAASVPSSSEAAAPAEQSQETASNEVKSSEGEPNASEKLPLEAQSPSQG